MKTITLKKGDPCPNDGGELKPARVPSEEQRRRAEDRETRDPLPRDMDTASEKQRRELGALYRCQSCGYMTRFPLEDDDDEHAESGGGGGDSRTAGADASSGAAAGASGGERLPQAAASSSRRSGRTSD